MKYIIALTVGLFVLGLSASYAGDAKDQTVYELRTYTTHEGKLDNLNARFRDHTLALFKKHGIKNIGYWTPVDTPNTLIYIIEHDSLEAAKKSWTDFIADPAWKKVAKESTQDGPILSKRPESVYMTATDYTKGMPAHK